MNFTGSSLGSFIHRVQLIKKWIQYVGPKIWVRFRVVVNMGPNMGRFKKLCSNKSQRHTHNTEHLLDNPHPGKPPHPSWIFKSPLWRGFIIQEGGWLWLLPTSSYLFFTLSFVVRRRHTFKPYPSKAPCPLFKTTPYKVGFCLCQTPCLSQRVERRQGTCEHFAGRAPNGQAIAAVRHTYGEWGQGHV